LPGVSGGGAAVAVALHSGFPRLGHLCRLVWLQVKRPNAFAVSYLVMNHTVSSIPTK
jgi:hypothetical protein